MNNFSRQRNAEFLDMSEADLIGQVLLRFTEGFGEYRQDISAVLLTPDKHLWLGSDETSTIERLSYVDEKNFVEHYQERVAKFISLPASEDEEIDIEGMAYGEYYLWVVGSHSYKRKKPKPDKTIAENIKRLTKVKSEPNRYILGRIPLVDGKLFLSCPHPDDSSIELSAGKLEVTTQGNVLMEALADDPHLGFFVKAAIPGKDNGFNIEGIEICQNRVLLGLRGPVLRGWAIMLEVELESIGSGRLWLKQIGTQGRRYKKHFLFLNGLGIRDLCWDGDDLLILAGPTMDLDGPVQVYRLQNGVNLPEDSMHEPEAILDLPYGYREDHAEGITLFADIIGERSIFVVHDSPKSDRLIDKSGLMADVYKL